MQAQTPVAFGEVAKRASSIITQRFCLLQRDLHFILQKDARAATRCSLADTCVPFSHPLF